MFSKENLEGIFLSLAKTEVSIERVDSSNIGYRVRLRVNLRSDSEPFLLGIKRSLLQHDIDSVYKQSEHKTRPRPILRIGGIKNLYKLCEIVSPELPDSKQEWKTFREAVSLVSNGEHLKLEGIEQLFRIKMGENWNGTD
tara:strand:+ start:668 stop:1087 length:420 start_codon:yes stop_codon:yes gene_type:complete